ncbi:MAG: GNAT family N-acetyltransferase [Burkholderiales bacterium]|nr:GNAT family N-acetyltransferase [Burkholderiales bacterium]
MSIELEAVERGELEALHAAAPEALHAALGLACETTGTALVSVAGALPPSAIVVNRTIGLGVAAPARPDTADAIVERYRRAGVRRYFVHVHPACAPPELRAWLLARGLEPVRGWMKFTRGREAPPAVTSTVATRRARAEEMAAFARIAAAAFDLGEASVPWLACLDRARDWHAYVAVSDDEVVGTGGLFVRDGIGWLDFGATAPAHRGRGAQSAILRQRILDALDLGCRVIATATGEAVPGDPQHSYNNIRKMGFREAYLRENFAPPKTG